MNGDMQRDSLSPERIARFAADLANLPAEEMRKSKVLFVRNAIAEFEAAKVAMASFKHAQGCLSIVPFFWPMLALQRRIIDAKMTQARQQIQNCIDVWRDDLGDQFDHWESRPAANEPGEPAPASERDF